MRIRITPALVISVIALFVALGGVANATVDLPWNSVGKEQLKWGAVDSSKVENRSLKAIDFAQGQLPQGKQGPKGDTGEKGETGARGPAGAAASSATGSGTGHTLKDAAGTSLGEILGVVGGPPVSYTVLWDGGVYQYLENGLSVHSSEVVFLSADCSGQPFRLIQFEPSSSRFAAMHGHNRWVSGVLGSPSTPVAYKATSAPPIHLTQTLSTVNFDTGQCDAPWSPFLNDWGVRLEQVPAPPSPAQQPLTID